MSSPFFGISGDLNAVPSLEKKYGTDIFLLTQPWPVTNYTLCVCVHSGMSVRAL